MFVTATKVKRAENQLPRLAFQGVSAEPGVSTCRRHGLDARPAGQCEGLDMDPPVMDRQEGFGRLSSFAFWVRDRLNELLCVFHAKWFPLKWGALYRSTIYECWIPTATFLPKPNVF